MRRIAITGIVLATTLLAAPAAFADDHGSTHGQELEGACSATSSYELKLEAKRGTQRLKFEVKAATAGEQWQLDLSADGVVLDPITRIASADDDDDHAEVEFKRSFASPVTSVKALATNLVTNETCSASIGESAPVTDPVVTDPVVTDPVVTDPVVTTQTTPKTKLTRAQVAQHGTTSDCWSIIGKNVYDLTSYVSQHPGGPSRIAGICGSNGTSAFKGQHMSDRDVAQVLSAFKIGRVKK